MISIILIKEKVGQVQFFNATDAGRTKEMFKTCRNVFLAKKIFWVV